MHRLYWLILFVSCNVALFGQVKSPEEYPIHSDTISSKNSSLLAIPLAFYTPETEFGFGAGAQLFFRSKRDIVDPQISNLFGTAIYTSRQQFILQLKTKTFVSQDQYLFDGNFKFQIFPNIFWGIGYDTPDSNAEDYNQQVVEFDVAFLKRIEDIVNFGFQFSYADYKITEVQEGGQLESGQIPGSEGAKLIGLGVILNIDQRDNYFSPLKGGFYQFKAQLTSRALGSNYSYNTFFLDFRKYFNLKKRRVFAAQVYTRLNFGEAPFQGQSLYGGSETGRGYFRGRYIDQHMYVIQAEYRQPIGKRWEFAVFALTGDVLAPEQALFSDFKSSVGLGPRFFLKKDNRACLRLDYAINFKGGSGIYFGVNEAF